MRQVSLAFSLVLLLCIVDSLAGATVVNSTFVGGDFAHLYSNAANWSPAEIPNNSSSKIYNVTVPSSVNVDIDATVENLTLTGQSLFVGGGRSYTIVGTASVGANSLLDSSGTLLIKGSLLNFDPSGKTLSGGRYSVFGADGRGAGSLNFPGADIVNNGASISLLGPLSMISDDAGRNGLRNFAHNLAGAKFAVVARDYTIDNVFTNDGLLTVGVPSANGLPVALPSSLRINQLTNYDSQSNRLAGGTYDIIASAGTASGIPAEPARLIVAGADIRRNAASITLEVSGAGDLVYPPNFTDENGNNALRNLVENEATGVFQLKFLTETFRTNSDFTNSGSVLLELSSLVVPASHRYRQSGGGTTLTGGNITGDVEISGGGFFAIEGLNQAKTVLQTPTINGNLTVGDALFDSISLRVNGSVLLSDSTRFLADARPGAKGLTVQSTLSLAGTLVIRTGATPTVAHAAAISGVFRNAPNGSRVFTVDGQGSYVVTYTSTDVTLSNYQPTTTPGPQMLNISSRAQVLTGDNVTIGGFIISGSDNINVVIRAIGPSLAGLGLIAPLQNPVIELHDSKGAVVSTNDNWQDTEAIELQATGLAPTDPRESAIFAALAPGAYTAVLRGDNGSSGIALLEAYNLSSGSQTKFANISTRGFVDADHVLIGGLIAGGKPPDTVRVVVRAIGRGLESSGVPFLPDASLEVRDRNGILVAANDDFGTPASNRATVPMELWPPSATDAAIGVTVAPGSYTVIVSGKNGANGNALVEIYDLNG